jgi:hypothetical protein
LLAEFFAGEIALAMTASTNASPDKNNFIVFQ